MATLAGKKVVPTGVATPISDSSLKVVQVTVLSDDCSMPNNGNTGIIYLGGAGVTPDDGYPLRPGYSETKENTLHPTYVNLNQLYVIAEDPNQEIRWIAVLED